MMRVIFFLIGFIFTQSAAASMLGGETVGNLTEPVDTQRMLDHHLYGVAWGNGQFVAVGSGSFNETEVLLSADGSRWNKVSLGTAVRPLSLSRDGAGVLSGIAWNGSIFVAAGERILTSADGKSWTVSAFFPTCAFTRVAAQEAIFVAVGGYYDGTGCIATSPDGRTWTERTSNIESKAAVLSGVIWTGSTFVAVGNTDRGKSGMSTVLLTSRDGMTWTRQLGTSDQLADVARNGSLFVAVGSHQRQGVIFTSPDAKTWTESTTRVSDPLCAVLWNGSLFVAVGLNGALFTSPDGMTWTRRKSHTTRDLLSIAWNGSLFVVVGEGVILTSAEGVAWKDCGDSRYS
ncbi:MAG TPA: hypothetical protein VGX03_35555 [Candidatus Binatia bacterium]|nr:hypothetical protein [Candidatus Binatia bacterium]